MRLRRKVKWNHAAFCHLLSTSKAPSHPPLCWEDKNVQSSFGYPKSSELTIWQWHLQNCGQLNNAPEDVHILISGTCGYATLHGKGYFVDVLKLKTLRWRDYPGLFSWAKVIKSDQSHKKEMLPWKQMLECWALKMEDGATSKCMLVAPRSW